MEMSSIRSSHSDRAPLLLAEWRKPSDEGIRAAKPEGSRPAAEKTNRTGMPLDFEYESLRFRVRVPANTHVTVRLVGDDQGTSPESEISDFSKNLEENSCMWRSELLAFQARVLGQTFSNAVLHLIWFDSYG